MSAAHNMLFSSRPFLLGLFTLTLLAVVTEGYLGPRYGKRYPGGEVQGAVGKSSGPRTIQSRSQLRFYGGSRYGGKRSYWGATHPELDPSDSLPYDCVYVPYVGLRCNPNTIGIRSESENVVGEMSENNYGYQSPSAARTNIIDVVGGSESSDS